MALWPLHSSAQFAIDRTGFADALSTASPAESRMPVMDRKVGPS
jgi:hypothetical protein